MGIQFKQIDNLQSTFDSLSGTLQTQITTISGSNAAMASGNFVFAGNKYFTGNVDFSGAQGILVDPDNIYTPNTVFAGKVKIGGAIATPRNSTSGPAGFFQVVGGQSYFDDQVNVRNSAGISITNGGITGGSGAFYNVTGEDLLYSSGNFTNALTVGGSPVSTGGVYYAGTGMGLAGQTFFTSGGGDFDTVTAQGYSGASFTGTSGVFNDFKITGTATGFLRLHNIPDYTETGNITDPATGTVFRSGNYLMIV